MSRTSRRHFLAAAAGTAMASMLPRTGQAAIEGHPEAFSFLFLTDTHLQPELNAAQGCSMAFKHARTLHADFAIQGGDHIFDGLGVPKSRSMQLYDLYAETEQQLGLKTYHTIGNHDVIGLYPGSGMSPGDPQYGKAVFQERIGKLYQSFDHKGVHFIVLDSIGFTPDRAYEGHIDAGQLSWLAGDLAKVPAAQPVIVSVHIPLVTAFSSYVPVPTSPPAHHGESVSNAWQVLPLFEGHHVLGVLQGHTHIHERVEWQGIPYITGGAVSGNWWKGVRMGTPEGFTVCTVRGGKLETRYETYGFQAVGS